RPTYPKPITPTVASGDASIAVSPASGILVAFIRTRFETPQPITSRATNPLSAANVSSAGRFKQLSRGICLPGFRPSRRPARGRDTKPHAPLPAARISAPAEKPKVPPRPPIVPAETTARPPLLDRFIAKLAAAAIFSLCAATIFTLRWENVDYYWYRPFLNT